MRIKRAREEITRCNIELRRLHTAIFDEERHFKAVLARAKASGTMLFDVILDYCTRRRRVNAYILSWVAKTFALDGFTGDTSLGRRRGTSIIRMNASNGANGEDSICSNDSSSILDGDNNVDGIGGDDEDLGDDDLEDDFDRMTNYISSVS